MFAVAADKFPALFEEIKECSLVSCRMSDNIADVISSLQSVSQMEECLGCLKRIGDNLWDTGYYIGLLAAAIERVAEVYSLCEMRISESAESDFGAVREYTSVGIADISSASPLKYDIKIGLS